MYLVENLESSSVKGINDHILNAHVAKKAAINRTTKIRRLLGDVVNEICVKSKKAPAKHAEELSKNILLNEQLQSKFQDSESAMQKLKSQHEEKPGELRRALDVANSEVLNLRSHQ